MPAKVMSKRTAWRADPHITGPELFKAAFDKSGATVRAFAGMVDVNHQSVCFWKDRICRPHPVFRMRIQEILHVPAPSWASSQEIQLAKLVISTHEARRSEELHRRKGWSVWRKINTVNSALVTMRAFLVLGSRPPMEIANESLISMNRLNAELKDADTIGKYLLRAKAAAARQDHDTAEIQTMLLDAARLGDAELIRRGVPTELSQESAAMFDGTFNFD